VQNIITSLHSADIIVTSSRTTSG